MLAYLLIVLLVIEQDPAPRQINLSWVFVNDNLAWESPPKELKKTYVEAGASLLVFYPTGDFAFVTCYLFRDRRSGRLSICRGCGFSISKGTWTRDPDNIVAVKFRTIYAPGLVEGTPKPGPEVERRWIFRGQSKGRVAAVVQSPEGKFIPLSNLSNLDDLSQIIAFYSREQK